MSKAPTTRPDFDTDVLWKQRRFTQKQRTISAESTDSEALSLPTERRVSTSSVDLPGARRLSITEMIFGSPAGGFSWGQSNLQGPLAEERKASITDDARFKELMKHQSRILGGEDGACSFKKRDYMK